MIIFDIISSFFKKLWNKGGSVPRINFNGYYRKLEYPTPFIELHKSAPGVEEVYGKLRDAHSRFREKRAEIVNREKQTEENKFSKFTKVHFLKIISKRTLLISFLLWIILIIVQSAERTSISDNLIDITAIIVFTSVPVLTVSKIIEVIRKRNYIKYYKRIENEFISIRNEYLRIKDVLEEDMDHLCLASLSQQERTEELHHRELIYLEEKHHLELVKLEEKRNKELTSINSKVNEIHEKAQSNSRDLKKIKDTFRIT